jgi:hypothetical protein
VVNRTALFLGVKQQKREADHSPYLMLTIRMNGAYLHSPTWHGALLSTGD